LPGLRTVIRKFIRIFAEEKAERKEKRYIVYLFFIPQKSEMIRFSFDFLFVMKSWG